MNEIFEIATVAGFPHSGSTLFADLFAAETSAVHVGELAMLFRRGQVSQAASCSCGAAASSCPVWSRVLKAGLSATDGATMETIDALVQKVIAADPWTRPAAIPTNLANVYRAVLTTYAEITGNRRIIDSSNWPRFSELLADSGAEFAVRPVQLIRSPVTAVGSRYRRGLARKAKDFGPARRAVTLMADTWRWRAWNRESEELNPLVVVRYEDLCSEPGEVLRTTADALGWPSNGTGAGVVHVEREHVFWGSRTARTGPIEVRLPTAPLPFGQVTERLIWWATRGPARRYGY